MNQTNSVESGWKEKFKERFTPPVLNGDWMGTSYNIPPWIETQVIEELISDALAKCAIMGPDRARTALKAKWLN